MAGNPPAAAEAPADWRKSVLQSYRNSEVREISKVLAALEGSATPASKLMLAMRFEDQIFKSAKDLADYRKKISKRLKKLRKNYVAPAAATPQGSSGAPGAVTSQGAGGGDNTEAKAELAAKLKRDTEISSNTLSRTLGLPWKISKRNWVRRRPCSSSFTPIRVGSGRGI